MKRIIVFVHLALIISFTAQSQSKLIRWQIEETDPAYGLTLRYLLPLEVLQKMTGPKFKPRTDEKGFGRLLLFIYSAPRYHLAGMAYDSLNEASIFIVGKNSMQTYDRIGNPNKAINRVYENYNFVMKAGKVGLKLNEENGLIDLKAKIETKDGVIQLRSSFNNDPEEKEMYQNIKVNNTSNTGHFSGSESIVPIEIDSVEIQTSGNTWLTELNLPAHPDRIWLNTEFTWDFTFHKNLIK